jgi:hypothetical protein
MTETKTRIQQWWIATGQRGGAGTEKKLGPFGSMELAMEVRAYVETAESFMETPGTPITYWVWADDDA